MLTDHIELDEPAERPSPAEVHPAPVVARVLLRHRLQREGRGAGTLAARVEATAAAQHLGKKFNSSFQKPHN